MTTVTTTAPAPGSSAGEQPVLTIDDVHVTFRGEHHGDPGIPAVRGVSLQVAAGEALAVVGESGSGKSATMLAVLGLHGHATVRGSVRFDGRELLGSPESVLRTVRGAGIAMIFQDPMTSLNPVLTVGRQLAMAMHAHQPGLSRQAAQQRAVELLERVAIPQARRRCEAYPHELSGGMRQRVIIAMAIANRPRVLIADEPTTALDVTVQAQIVELLGELRRDEGLALILVTHDLGVVAGAADRVAVMYAGTVVEHGPVDAFFAAPGHPYGRGLLGCLARLDRDAEPVPIGGHPVSPRQLPPGCSFAPRCPLAEPSCDDHPPSLRPWGATVVACDVVTRAAGSSMVAS